MWFSLSRQQKELTTPFVPQATAARDLPSNSCETAESTERTETFLKNLRIPGDFRGGNFFSVITCFPTASLFLLDGLANLIDFVFHFWMGRTLTPPDFAVLQTINSIVLVYVTASGVFQPVVGRFVAEARVTGAESMIPAIFQTFLRASLWLG